jgi:hypothetical protein
MKSTWVKPDTSEIQKWISIAVTTGVNELGTDGAKRLDGTTGILQATIDRVRGAIGTGGRVALSATPNTIPGEARRNFWILAIYDLVNSTPNVGDFALKSGFEKMWQDAEDWIEAVSKGEQIVSSPTDPDPDNTPRCVVWGDGSGISTSDQVAVVGEAGVSVAVPQTTPGKEDMTTQP